MGTERIPLHGRNSVRAHAIVDAADLAGLSRWRWHMDSAGYARRSTSIGSRTDGSRRVIAIKLHRQILGLVEGDGLHVDHINGDRLDNRRANLRILRSRAEQSQNRRPDRETSSRFRGVSWHKDRRKWQATAMIEGVQNYLGLYDDEEAAAQVAADYRREHMPFTVEQPA